MDWKDCGSEGFMIMQEDVAALVVLDPEDMILIASVCLDGGVSLDPDDPFDMSDIGEDDLHRLARDLIDASLFRRSPAVMH